jgi:hypothetical protein
MLYDESTDPANGIIPIVSDIGEEIKRFHMFVLLSFHISAALAQYTFSMLFRQLCVINPGEWGNLDSTRMDWNVSYIFVIHSIFYYDVNIHPHDHIIQP